jgi:hypothetical protein
LIALKICETKSSFFLNFSLLPHNKIYFGNDEAEKFCARETLICSRAGGRIYWKHIKGNWEGSSDASYQKLETLFRNKKGMLCSKFQRELFIVSQIHAGVRKVFY